MYWRTDLVCTIIVIMLKTHKRTSIIKKMILPLVIVLAMASGIGIGSRPVQATPSDCPDPIEKWYACWQNLSTWRTQVNLWCAFADSDKREDCELTLISQLDYTPSGLNLPAACDNASTAFRTPGDCYATLKGGAWKDAFRSFETDCTFSDPDPDCSERLRTEFAEENNWASSGPTPGASGNGAVKINDTGARTTFINRVSTYIKWFSVGIGILAVFGLVISGIQYAAAQDNPQAVSGAKTRINNIIIGILIYLVMFGLLQWLIPGGLFAT